MSNVRQVIWWNVQRMLRPNGSGLSKALKATEAEGWSRVPFEEKLTRCAATLRLIADGVRPAIVGLAEVADDDLAERLSEMSGLGLKVVRDETPGFAGADVVLLVDGDLFPNVSAPTGYNVSSRFTTRDMYEVVLKTAAGYEVVVVGCHWPSRIVSNSEPLRIAAADWCRRLVEGHLKFGISDIVDNMGRRKLPPLADVSARARRAILVIGDFNDCPFNTSVDSVLGCVRDPAKALGSMSTPRGRGGRAVDSYLARRILLLNPCWPLLMGAPEGSTYWNSEWFLLDQVVCSPGMVSNGTVGAHQPEGIQLVNGSVRLHAPRTVSVGGVPVSWCSAAGVPKPYDPKTRRGISDHLPLSFQISIPPV